MTHTELTDEQICDIGEEIGSPYSSITFARAVIAADRALQDARHAESIETLRVEILKLIEAASLGRDRQDAIHAEELAAYELTVSNLRAAQGRDKHWHDTAWNRGHQMGMAANRDIARQATEALAKEREAHAETNRMMTEALMQAESAQGGPDIRALFWQLRAKILKLPRYSFLSPQGGGVVRVPDSCGRWIEADDAAGLCEVEEVDALIAAAPQPPAQPEPAPTSVSLKKRAELEAHGYVVNGVAMMHPETRRRVMLDYCGFVGWCGLESEITRFRTQQERKPMTRNQVDDLTEDGVFLRSVCEIVQAVEAFHGIKETK